MIPTLLLVGVVLGAFVHDRKSAWRVVATIDVVAIFWGVVVGLADGALTTVVAGGALGLGNLAIGALIAASVRSISSRMSAPTATTPD